MADRRPGNAGSGGGIFNLVSVIVLVVAVLGVGVAAVLLARTMAVAQSINAKATVIAQTGRGINTATDSIVLLNRTNEHAASILNSAKPLEAVLTTIVSTAGEINAQAGSINASATSINDSAGGINASAGSINTSATTINTNAMNINSTAQTINGVAKDINGKAAEILDVAKRIDVDAKNINDKLDGTIATAQLIKGDSANILQEAIKARYYSDCIAQKLYLAPPITGGPPITSGHCQEGF